jgi:cell division protein FtsI (penicillin-binding protein 3)
VVKRMREQQTARAGGTGTRLRALLLGLVVLLAFGAVIARAAKVQLFDVSRLSRLARDQTKRQLEWAPRRGRINDRNGMPLAVTEDVESVFADPSAFPTPADRARVTDLLAKGLRVPREKIAKKLDGEKQFVWIQRKLDDESAQRIHALLGDEHLDGLELVREPKRFYPQRELAGQILGFVGEDAGQEGLERELEPYLRGKSVQVSAVRDARGTMVMETGAPDPSQLTGATITTTLDATIQLTAERELRKAVTEANAAGGWAVVMDATSGAVLALANSSEFDANKPGRDPGAWRDRAVQDQIEPGSTIKSFLMSLALEAKVIKPEETMFCENGSWHTFGRTIHDTHPIGFATPAMVLSHSSNICAAKIGVKLGGKRLIDGLRAFGFGEKSDVGLPGEGKGQLRDPAHIPMISVATTAFGQGMSATGLQTVAAMGAIADGGVLLKPYLIERIVSSDGAVLKQGGRAEVRRVIRPETAKAVTQMLVEVTQKGGTGTRAALADYAVAGKTGTAQKVDPVRGGYTKKNLASFLGFVPAEAPRLVILVAIDEPEVHRMGGDAAAPAWSAIAKEALRQLGVAPTHALASLESVRSR